MTTDVRSSVSAYSIARGVGFATVALLVELALPLVTTRAEDAMAVAPIDPVPYLSGALLRWAASVIFFAAIAWTVAETRSRALRGLALAASALVLFVEAGSYRWLGETGALLSFRGTLFPLLAYVGSRAALALAVAAVGSAVALGIASLLEPALRARYTTNASVAVDAMLLAVAVLFGSATIWLGGGSLRIGATPPLVAWFLETEAPAVVEDEPEPVPEFDPSGVRLPPPDVLAVVSTSQQLRHPEELVDPAHPYCRPEEPVTAPADARSVVLLVLRGVSIDAIRGERPALPTLARLAADGASFDRAMSGSDDPTQGLVQILSGVSPLAPARYHEMAQVPRLPSLPDALGRLGMRSTFVSSFDLSAGRERTFLRDLHFAGIDEPSFASEAARGATSGSDAATTSDLIARLTATASTGPRFVVATLRGALLAQDRGATSPPPADAGVPELDAGAAADAGVVADAGDVVIAAADPLADVERELARFVAWFDANERARGTVLIVTSDSAPAGAGIGRSSMRFGVPLVFSNLRLDERNRGRARASSLVGLLDVADTILGLEGQGPTGCFQGRDLLAPREPPPRRRRLLAFAGPDQSFVYVFDSRFRWQIDRSALEAPFRVCDAEEDLACEHDLFDEADPATPLVRDQVLAMLGLGQYLAANDRFVPGSRAGARPAVTPRATTQLHALANASLPAVTSSLAANKAGGFGAFVLSVGIDEATLEPTSSGKPLAEVLAALARPLGTLELALDVAMPEVAVPARSVEAARRLALVLEASGLTGTITLLPRDPVMAMSLAARTSRPVLIRIPTGGGDLVELADSFGANGVVLASESVTPDVVTRAHERGLRVVLDGIASAEALDAFATAVPDFAIVTTNSPIRRP